MPRERRRFPFSQRCFGSGAAEEAAGQEQPLSVLSPVLRVALPDPGGKRLSIPSSASQGRQRHLGGVPKAGGAVPCSHRSGTIRDRVWHLLSVRSLGPRHSHRTRRRHHHLMPRKVGEIPIRFGEKTELCQALRGSRPGWGSRRDLSLPAAPWLRRGMTGVCRLRAPSGAPGLRFSALGCGSRGVPAAAPALGDSSVTPPVRREAAALQSGTGKQEGEARKSGSGAAFSRSPAGNPDRRMGWSKAARAGLRGPGGAPCFPASSWRSAAGIGVSRGSRPRSGCAGARDPSGHGQGAVPPGTALEELAPPAGAGPTGARFSFL